MEEKITIGSADGAELDPCVYEVEQVLENVTIEILRCPDCGKYSIGWKRQPNTREIEEL